MEKKTTRRIIGVLVVIALVIILLPLLNSGGETQNTLQTAETKAPPFPAPHNDSNTAPTATVVAQNTAAPVQSVIQKMVAAHKDAAAAATTVADSKSDEDKVVSVAEANAAAPVSDEKQPEVADAAPAATSSAEVKSSDIAAVVPAPAASADTAKAEVKTVTAKNSEDFTITHDRRLVSGEEALNQIKSPAWVVQMGSFKSRDNAIRLTNALRSKGYKAFTYETKSNGQTRVYIGPEFKQVAASTLVSKIASDMKMHGIIVTYKPLELEG